MQAAKKVLVLLISGGIDFTLSVRNPEVTMSLIHIN